MIAVDTNILVYAHRRDSEWHRPAAERLHGVERLWSADRDFSRFAGIRVVNPLVEQ